MQILAVGLGWGGFWDCSRGGGGSETAPRGCPGFWFQDDSFEYQGANKIVRKAAFSVGLRYGNRKSVGLSLRGLPVCHETQESWPRVKAFLALWMTEYMCDDRASLLKRTEDKAECGRLQLWGKKHLHIPRWWQGKSSSGNDRSIVWLAAGGPHARTRAHAHTRTRSARTAVPHFSPPQLLSLSSPRSHLFCSTRAYCSESMFALSTSTVLHPNKR